MSSFVTVHDGNRTVLLNLDHVVQIRQGDSGGGSLGGRVLLVKGPEIGITEEEWNQLSKLLGKL